jgi:hypothetical protein
MVGAAPLDSMTQGGLRGPEGTAFGGARGRLARGLLAWGGVAGWGLSYPTLGTKRKTCQGWGTRSACRGKVMGLSGENRAELEVVSKRPAAEAGCLLRPHSGA